MADILHVEIEDLRHTNSRAAKGDSGNGYRGSGHARSVSEMLPLHLVVSGTCGDWAIHREKNLVKGSCTGTQGIRRFATTSMPAGRQEAPRRSRVSGHDNGNPVSTRPFPAPSGGGGTFLQGDHPPHATASPPPSAFPSARIGGDLVFQQATFNGSATPRVAAHTQHDPDSGGDN